MKATQNKNKCLQIKTDGLNAFNKKIGIYKKFKCLHTEHRKQVKGGIKKDE